LTKVKDKTKNEKKSSSTLYDDISKIDELVDRIILENKEKLDKIHREEIDIEKFSLKNKRRNTLYYLKRKSSKKISSESKESDDENLPEEKIEKTDGTPEEKPINKRKKRIIFGKKDKKVDDKYNAPPPTTEDLLESDEFKEVVSEIDNIEEYEAIDQTEKDAKVIDEKIKDTPKTEEPHEKKDTAKDKATDLAEKHGFISKEETSEFKDKKDVDWISFSTDGLAELKKKYSKNLTISGLDSTKTDELKKDEPGFLDEKIKETPIDKDSEAKETKTEKEGEGASKAKKSVFGRGHPILISLLILRRRKMSLKSW